MAAKDDLGYAGEEHATQYLLARGYQILERNWHCDQGEVDIVATKERVIAFIEVKTRRSLTYGHPFEAIDERKRHRLWRLAHVWARLHPLISRGMTLRVEAIGIVGGDPRTGSIEHLVDLR